MIKGSIVELVVPTEANGAIKYESLEALVDWHVVEGSAALLVGDIFDSALKLDAEERLELLRRVVWQAERRIAVIAGISAESFDTVVEYAGIAEEAATDALLITPPASVWATKDEALRYVGAVAEEARKQPLLVRGGAGMAAAAVVNALAHIRGVGGFVESAPDLARARELLALPLPAEFALYAGGDADAAPLVLEGFAGNVSTAANLVPRMVRKVNEAALLRDRAAAETVQTRLQALQQALPTEHLPRAIQWALIEMGRVAESTPPPALSQQVDYAGLRRALRVAGCAI
jgi:4-hydroxy-tetrahydrodipicolinate synthase